MDKMGYKFYSLVHILTFLVLFSACTQEEEGLDTPMYEQSDVPISFSIGKWESRQTELEKYPELKDPSKSEFVDGDELGVFAYYLQGGNENQISNLVPNFMYNQDVLNIGTGWTYSPVKYWSNNPSDKFRFCAYYPYNHPTLSLSSNTQIGLPTLTYTMPDDKTAGKVDLLYADEIGQKMSVDNSLLLNFKHLLGKIQFNVSITSDNGQKHPDGCEPYRALIQAVKFKVNWKGSFDYQLTNNKPEWTILNGETRDFLQLTVNPAGELISNEKEDNDENNRLLGSRIVHDFTAFLLPVTIDEFEITVNNMTTKHSVSNVQVKAGMVTTINVTINALTGDARFYATFSRWEEGGDLNYDLQ